MSTLFEDSFKTTSVDSARYDRVSRITAQSQNHDDIHLTLDVNTELFPMSKGDVVTIALASQLTDKETTYSGWREPKVGEKSLADDYDYVMYGTVYKFEEGSGEKVAVYVSFGGLLLCLEGGYRHLSSLKQENVYLLMRA
ncbi:DNA-directed RNA polymerases I, II, and III subunit RPABC3 [Yarrowia sp. B02]|nr:DNA-directed RNA polymerases I, II, and III subunit RPABC3 [Yarrowia sp. B02]